MRIVFDNNIWISFLIGKRLSALRSAFSLGNVEIFFCDELENEDDGITPPKGYGKGYG